MKINKWYKSEDGALVNFQGYEEGNNDIVGYAIFRGKWYDCSDTGWRRNTWELATDDEVKAALFKEIEKRGFKEGVKIKSAYMDAEIILEGKSEYYDCNTITFMRGCVFNSGKWAEVVKKERTAKSFFIIYFLKKYIKF